MYRVICICKTATYKGDSTVLAMLNDARVIFNHCVVTGALYCREQAVLYVIEGPGEPIKHALHQFSQLEYLIENQVIDKVVIHTPQYKHHVLKDLTKLKDANAAITKCLLKLWTEDQLDAIKERNTEVKFLVDGPLKRQVKIATPWDTPEPKPQDIKYKLIRWPAAGQLSRTASNIKLCGLLVRRALTIGELKKTKIFMSETELRRALRALDRADLLIKTTPLGTSRYFDELRRRNWWERLRDRVVDAGRDAGILGRRH